MVRQIITNKKQYLDLLLLADEQEDMIDRYLERGDLFILAENDEVKSICVVTNEGDGICELKNMATVPNVQRKGYATQLMKFICNHYAPDFKKMKVGTGESPLTLPFYESCGFVEAYRVENFFIDNYHHPIIECGIQLIDMIYLIKDLRKE